MGKAYDILSESKDTYGQILDIEKIRGGTYTIKVLARKFTRGGVYIIGDYIGGSGSCIVFNNQYHDQSAVIGFEGIAEILGLLECFLINDELERSV